MRVLLLAANKGPDYLQDLVIHGLAQTEGIELSFNVFPPHLATDYEPTAPLYGCGFTAFRRLGPNYTYWANKQVNHSAQTMKWDLVIYLNAQRYYDDDEAMHLRSQGSIIFALDGEDNTEIVLPALKRCELYFKRELIHNHLGIRPISFKIPADALMPPMDLNSKTCILAPCDPRHRASYVFTTEANYYSQYSRSYFGATMKKGGWDCMRHYEILAAGALPLFLGYENKPRTIMQDYPHSLQLAANELSAKFLLSEKPVACWQEEYLNISHSFREWLESSGTTREYASLFIRAFMEIN